MICGLRTVRLCTILLAQSHMLNGLAVASAPAHDTNISHVSPSQPSTSPVSTTTPIPTSSEYAGGNNADENSNSTDVSPALYLDVSASPPDPLGVAEVSGFYSPGAWAAWFLIVAGAWFRILRKSEERHEVNTYLFLLATNWAAIDIFRAIHSVRKIPLDHEAYAAEVGKRMGPLAAAFAVVFWGALHGFLQSIVSAVIFRSSKCRDIRVRTLMLGLMIPFAALLVSTYLAFMKVDGVAGGGMDLLPALYWRGMAKSTHDWVFLTACLTPLAVVQTIMLNTFCGDEQPLPDWPSRNVRQLIRRFMQSEITHMIFVLTFMVGFISFQLSAFMSLFSGSEMPFWGFVIPSVLFGFTILWNLGPVIWVFTILIMCIIYVVKAYLRLGSNVSESCFFMPCSRQSISESDQLYTLLAGLMVFFKDIGPPLLRKLADMLLKSRFTETVGRGYMQFEIRRTATEEPDT